MQSIQDEIQQFTCHWIARLRKKILQPKQVVESGLAQKYAGHVYQARGVGKGACGFASKPIMIEDSPPIMKAWASGAKIREEEVGAVVEAMNGGFTPMPNLTHLNWLAPQIVPLGYCKQDAR